MILLYSIYSRGSNVNGAGCFHWAAGWMEVVVNVSPLVIMCSAKEYDVDCMLVYVYVRVHWCWWGDTVFRMNFWTFNFRAHFRRRKTVPTEIIVIFPLLKSTNHTDFQFQHEWYDEKKWKKCSFFLYKNNFVNSFILSKMLRLFQ